MDNNLDDIKHFCCNNTPEVIARNWHKEIESLRQQLAALRSALDDAEKVEPVAWVKLNDESDFTFQKPVLEAGYLKLYTHPTPAVPDYTWTTIQDYEHDAGFETNIAFRSGWNMARTTNRFLSKLATTGDWKDTTMTNPNNCATCNYSQLNGNLEKGHCYMFRDEPTEVCMQHTGRQK